MGASASAHPHHHHHHHANLHVCVQLVMPLYYTDEAVTEEDRAKAQASWNYILENTSPEFIVRRDQPGFGQVSALTWFFSVFYSRLFDVHPACKPLFKDNLVTQGKFLAKMISFLLQMKDSAQLTKALTALAHRHVYKYNVRAFEYGIIGEVLLYSIGTVIGLDQFDPATSAAWIRIYSMAIRVIVPIHVQHEIDAHSDALKPPNSHFGSHHHHHHVETLSDRRVSLSSSGSGYCAANDQGVTSADIGRGVTSADEIGIGVTDPAGVE